MPTVRRFTISSTLRSSSHLYFRSGSIPLYCHCFGLYILRVPKCCPEDQIHSESSLWMSLHASELSWLYHDSLMTHHPPPTTHNPPPTSHHPPATTHHPGTATPNKPELTTHNSSSTILQPAVSQPTSKCTFLYL